MVTMREIDEARARLAAWKSRHECDPESADQVRIAEAEVERLLREWWDQGCRELPTGDVYALIASQRDEARERAESSEADAKNAREGFYVCQREMDAARRREAEVRDAMQSAIDRAREACAGNLSPGNDWIDELIGLLRVTRGQRDDAERQIGQWRAAGEAKVAECDRLAKVAEEARRDYAVAAKQIEWDRAEIAKLTLSATELDATNKKIHADRDRLATAMREALEHLSHCPYHVYRAAAETILSATLKDYESITEVSSYKERYFPEGGAFRSTCACGLHELPSAGYVDDALGHHKGKRCSLTFTAPSKVDTLMHDLRRRLEKNRDRWAAEAGRLAAAIADALKVLRGPGGKPEIAEEILSFAVSAHDGDRKFEGSKNDGPKGDGTPYATHAEVEAEIVRQYRDEIIPRVEKRIDEKIKAYANNPDSIFVGKLRCK